MNTGKWQCPYRGDSKCLQTQIEGCPKDRQPSRYSRKPQIPSSQQCNNDFVRSEETDGLSNANRCQCRSSYDSSCNTVRTELPNETQNQRLNPSHVLVPFTLSYAFAHEERSTVHHQRHTPKYANEPNVVNLSVTLFTNASTNSTMECKDGRRTILQQ